MSNCLKYWCEKHPKAVWPKVSLKVKKGHTKINVKHVQDFVETIPAKL